MGLHVDPNGVQLSLNHDLSFKRGLFKVNYTLINCIRVNIVYSVFSTIQPYRSSRSSDSIINMNINL